MTWTQPTTASRPPASPPRENILPDTIIMPPKRPSNSSAPTSRAKRAKSSIRPVRVVRSIRGVPIPPNVRANAAKRVQDESTLRR